MVKLGHSIIKWRKDPWYEEKSRGATACVLQWELG